MKSLALLLVVSDDDKLRETKLPRTSDKSQLPKARPLLHHSQLTGFQMVFKGIENVDPATRELQHRVVLEIWKTLNEAGIGQGATGRISGYFTASSKSTALELFKEYKKDQDFETTRRKKKNVKEWTVEILTPECHFTIEAFTDLVDMYLIDAAYFDVKFNGLEVARSNVRVRKPWWRFW